MEDKPTISIILTMYKRDTLEMQLSAILNQTWKPSEILIWQNESHVLPKLSNELMSACTSAEIPLRHVHSSFNFKFHGRFTLPLVLLSDYVAIFDDDTIPGPMWLENCLNTSVQYDCAVGGNGRTVKDMETMSLTGPAGFEARESVEQVDWIGHCWFFKREWIHHMWAHSPSTLENGEDIHFSASLSLAGIPSYCPAQPIADRRLWGDLVTKFHGDDHASYKKPGHTSLRAEIVKHWVEKGWKLLISERVYNDE